MPLDLRLSLVALALLSCVTVVCLGSGVKLKLVEEGCSGNCGMPDNFEKQSRVQRAETPRYRTRAKDIANLLVDPEFDSSEKDGDTVPASDLALERADTMQDWQYFNEIELRCERIEEEVENRKDDDDDADAEDYLSDTTTETDTDTETDADGAKAQPAHQQRPQITLFKGRTEHGADFDILVELKLTSYPQNKREDSYSLYMMKQPKVRAAEGKDDDRVDEFKRDGVKFRIGDPNNDKFMQQIAISQLAGIDAPAIYAYGTFIDDHDARYEMAIVDDPLRREGSGYITLRSFIAKWPNMKKEQELFVLTELQVCLFYSYIHFAD